MPANAQKQDAAARPLIHDLKTPLTSLRSCLDLILAGDAGPVTADQIRFLQAARRNTTRLGEMIETALSPADGGGEDPGRSLEVDIGPILADAAALQNAAARRAGQTLDLTGLPASFVAGTEPAGLVRIFENVLGNAIRHAGPGALVRVWLDPRTRPDPGLALSLARHCFLPCHFFSLVVEDSGPGLPAGIVDERGIPLRTGRGLGLGIAADLARARGGGLRLASRPGAGTTAWIRLPLDRDTAHLVRVAESFAATLAGRGALALLDLREGPGAAAVHADRVAGFLDENRGSVLRPGVELAPGLWAAVVADPSAWEAAWAAFLAGAGGSLSGSRWTLPALTATGNPGELQETFNPGRDAPMKTR
jgi:hypothetical protein